MNVQFGIAPKIICGPPSANVQVQLSTPTESLDPLPLKVTTVSSGTVWLVPASAIGAMVSAGGSKIVEIVAVGGKKDLEDCAPCGGCRQRILEFADENTRIIYRNGGEFQNVSIDDLLPASFRLK